MSEILQFDLFGGLEPILSQADWQAHPMNETQTEHTSSFSAEALIPARYMANVRQRVISYNAKLKKLGLEEFSIVTSDPQEAFFPIETKEGVIQVKIPAVRVNITGPEYRFGDYKLLAKVDHRESPPRVQTFSNFQFKSFGEALSCRCDHCNTERDRKTVFFVQKDNEQSMAVGGSCVGDLFEGLTAERALSTISLWEEASNVAQAMINEEKNRWIKNEFGVNAGFYLVKEVIAVLLKILKVGPYVSKQFSADTGCRSSVDLVQEVLDSDCDLRVYIGETEQQAKDLLEQARIHFQNTPPSSEFDTNLALIVNNEYVSEKQLGTLIYLPTFLDQQALIQSRLRKQNTSHFIGDQGESYAGPLRLNRCVKFDGRYSFGFLYNFEDESGNILIASTGKDPSDFGVAIGQWAYVTGKIKKHSMYQGIKQTEINGLGIQGNWAVKPTSEEIHSVVRENTLFSIIMKWTKSSEKLIGKNLDEINQNQVLLSRVLTQIDQMSFYQKVPFIERLVSLGIDLTPAKIKMLTTENPASIFTFADYLAYGVLGQDGFNLGKRLYPDRQWDDVGDECEKTSDLG